VPQLSRSGFAALALGVLLLTALLLYNGAGDVLAVLASAGSGLLLVALFHLVPMFADALGWRQLVAPPVSPASALKLRWIGESINGLLPVFQLGGNVVKAQLLTRRGVSAPAAGASVVVDVTTITGAQLVFTLLGLGLLIQHLGGGSLLLPLVVGFATMGVLLSGFLTLQRRGMFAVMAQGVGRLRRGGRWPGLAAGAAELDERVAALYRDPGAVFRALGWHLLSWFLGAGEVWLALYFIGHPVGWLTAVLLESLGQAIRVAAFVIPGAMGVQEGGYLVLGRAVGLAPETCLALSLAKRVREIVLGVPGLVVWQWEGAMARSGV